MGGIIDTILEILENAWDVFLLLAPLFLIGLFTAGLLYVLFPQASIRRFFGSEGLSSVTKAAAFGVPLPICSCGVIPMVAALRRKGASRSANMSFLITTPETGTDSIFVTWGLMGPVMAFVRPVAAFFTALMAGVLSIAMLRGPDRSARAGADDHEHAHDHGHGHAHSHDLDEDPAVVGPRGLIRSTRAAFRGLWHRLIRWSRLSDWNRPTLDRWEDRRAADAATSVDSDATPLRVVSKRVFTFAFIEMADDILFALVIGVLLSGVVMVLVPDNLAQYGLGGGVTAYAVMLLAGIPLYMCASASTPIAAALVAKGLSPGAALVFLLTGPATNTATIVVLLKQFGARFVGIYLGSIVVGAMTAGVLLDLALIAFGWKIAVNLDGGEGGLIGVIEWIGAILLLMLIFWRFAAGAATQGFADLTANLRATVFTISGLAQGSRLSQILSFRSNVVRFGLPALVAAYVVTGFTAVPPGHLGYAKMFGAVVGPGLSPGLHYALPWPVGAVDVFPSSVTHRVVVGLQAEPAPAQAANPRNGNPVEYGAGSMGMPSDRTTPSAADMTGSTVSGAPAAGPQAAARKTQSKPASGTAAWHTSDFLAGRKSRLAEFLAGDGNFVRLLISVHYRVPDPYTFYYRAAEPDEIVAHGVQATAREFIAKSHLTDLLSRDRTEIERYILKDLREHLGAGAVGSAAGPVDDHGSGQGADEGAGEERVSSTLGLEIVAVNIIDIHPPPETASAFREVTGAQIDRETSILEAERSFTLLVPRAIGNADIELRRGAALAEGKTARASAERDAFLAKAEAVARARSVLSDLLWFETNERSYAGRELFVLPPGAKAGELNLWRTRDAAAAAGEHHDGRKGQKGNDDHQGEK